MWKKIKEWIKKTIPQKTELDNFRLVYRTTESHLAQIMEIKLKEDNIHVFKINKRDSSYNSFGAIELYVKAEDVVRAKYIIDKKYE